jgi:nucleolar pre-ribosomal-associated protein 2
MIFQPPAIRCPLKHVRITQASWQLFEFLLNAIPLPNAARILSDRKFIAILQQTLRDAEEDTDLHKARDVTSNGVVEASSEALEAAKPSKKRTRSGHLIVNKDYKPANGLAGLVAAIYAAIQRLVHYARNSLSHGGDVDGRSGAFKSEYIRSIVQTTPEASATILGTWMSLCQKVLEQQSDSGSQPSNLLEPFVDIWNYRLVGNEDLMQFSLHCSDPLFALLKQAQSNISTREWKVCLEQMVARNIILPAKSDAVEKPDLTLLENLTKVSILQDVTNAALLFDIAIRSLQPHSGHRRRSSDEAWLQRAFTSFCTSMSQNKSGAHSQAICAILRSSREHNIDLGLPGLRKITAEYIIPEGTTDWTLLEEMVRLDANVFLIPGEDDKNLLYEVLGRITNVYFDPNWPRISSQIVSGVAVPLMNEFAKARDLSGFIRHWYEQLVKFEALRDENMILPMDSFCVWEDEALQQELCKLLEPSLTLQQILQLLDWLAVEIPEHPNAVCVILEAISGSIRNENVVDAIGTRLIHTISDNGIENKLGGRYSWRFWRILSNSIRWMQSSHLNEIADLWDKTTKSFESTIGTKDSPEKIEEPGHSERLNSLEFLRNACATWDSASNNKLNALARSAVLQSLERLAYDIAVLPQALVDGHNKAEWSLQPNTLSRDFGWYTWARVKCVLDEFPRTLE